MMARFFMLVSGCYLLVAVSPCFPDVVWTRSFNYEGTIIEETEEYVVLQIGARKKKIARANIQSITYSEVPKPTPPPNISGEWYADGAGGQYFSGPIYIFQEGDKMFLKWVFSDGSVLKREVVGKHTQSGIRVDYIEAIGNGDYYIINSNGDLEIRDSMSLIQTAKKK